MLSTLRTEIANARLSDAKTLLDQLQAAHPVTPRTRERATAYSTELVTRLRKDGSTGLMELFLGEYGLSSEEGIALMCLAEALLRVPDTDTIDALIEDKIAPSAWSAHLGKSSSALVNASTWALMLTGKVLQDDDGDGIASTLHNAVRRVGEPVIRKAVARAMRELGQQFVLGRTIEEAQERGSKARAKGYTYSYDMLGEAALTDRDARAFHASYADTIDKLAPFCTGTPRQNPGVSIKLSALHPRYETLQRDLVLTELVDTARDLTLRAAKTGMGLNIDAEEADRLDLSLDVIEALLSDPALAGWDGFGVVVQAYGKRAPFVLDWLYALSQKLDRKIMVRLVKGAYWDTEIKRAQVEGLDGFPVFTRKCETDVSYICCAAKLAGMTDRIYPQFATHNAQTVAVIRELFPDETSFEFQRLHGMGEGLYDVVLKRSKAHCRIYAPVGPHKDLLAYLVRRLLENGANSSFVSQIADEDVPVAEVVADPFEQLATPQWEPRLPRDLYAPERINSRGWDIHEPATLEDIMSRSRAFATSTWQAGPLIAGAVTGAGNLDLLNPAGLHDHVGTVTEAGTPDVEVALQTASPWSGDTPQARSDILNRAADLYEANAPEIFALLAREAGKTLTDAVAELREAVDFLRYYAAQGILHGDKPARGTMLCISPWNFPLAIFTGQIAAALAAGNAVIAKPAETTPLIAGFAVRLLLDAGVPQSALQLLPGTGATVGAALTSDPRIDGVCFTGSTATAQAINRAMSRSLSPFAPLIAETGGINAMIVDSSALPQQAISDVIASAFQSAGQRCSACRVLYLQDDIADEFLEMLYGAMVRLRLGDPSLPHVDVGPVITEQARRNIQSHIDRAARKGRLLRQMEIPEQGHFVGPAVIRVNGISDVTQEVFGPVLHVARFPAEDLSKVVADINASGYGLTFGMHSRIDDRVEEVTQGLTVGNIYINRNQIGAVVGSQPFGGMGLSGTGPKAGGPSYLERFKASVGKDLPEAKGNAVPRDQVQSALNTLPAGTAKVSSQTLPGPTGESNRLSHIAKGPVLCLGPGLEAATAQADIARTAGCAALVVAPGAIDGIDGTLAAGDLQHLSGFALVALWSDAQTAQPFRQALGSRDGAILSLSSGDDLAGLCTTEQHICVDTTAAGGNAELLARSG